MGEIFRFTASLVCTLIGLFALVSGVAGVFRFRQSLSRLQSAAVIDTLGIMFMLLGLMFAMGDTIANIKMFITIMILWLTSPVSSHLICRMEVCIDDKLQDKVSVCDLAAVERERKGE